MGEFMKKSKAIAIFCLLFMILIVFALCSSLYLNKKQVNKNIILAKEVQNNDNGGGTKRYGLTKEQVEAKFDEMKEAPTYDELVKLAKSKYGMSEDLFKVALGWAKGEAYDRLPDDSGNLDYYLGYLCDCVGLNFYMGYGLTSADELAAKLRGGGPMSLYSTSALTNKAQEVINNPKSYANTLKAMSLVLDYPEENAHDCYGPSESERQYYFSKGGEVFYSGGIYAGYRIEVWTQWYRSGFKRWNVNGKYSSGNGSTLGGGKDSGTVVLDKINPRIDYADLCKSSGFRRASKIAGIIILVAKWLSPLILIIIGMTDFIKAMVSNEDDSLGKATKTFIIRMVIAIITPFIPGLIYYLADYFIGDIKDETGELVSCTECLSDPFSCEIQEEE